MRDIPQRRPAVMVARMPFLLLAMVLTLAACGGSSKSGGGTPASSTSSGSAPTTAAATTAGSASGSMSGTPSSSAAPSSAAPSSGASSAAGGAQPSDPARARAEIERNWATFFNAQTPTAKRVMLLQNGQALEQAIGALSHSPMGKGVSSKVTAVSFDSATMATVTYQIALKGRVVLPRATGRSVYQNGTWKVGTQSLCALLQLMPGGQGKSVPGC